MIINCPQCKTRYEIDASVVPLSGRRMRCAKCGEVWRAYPQELPAFEESVKAEQPPAPARKTPSCAAGTSCFWLSLFKIAAILLIILAVISAYVFRYPIAERFPALTPLCKSLNLDCAVPGRGFEFKDISFHEYDDENDLVHKMDISGKISNPTAQDLALPLLHIELLDEEGNVLQNIDQALSADIIRSGTTAGFKTTILNPAPFTKYVYVTFAGND